MIIFINLVDFTNDKYKLLKFLYDNQIKIKNNKYIALSQQEIADSLHFSKNKTNNIIQELKKIILLILLIILKVNILLVIRGIRLLR